MSTRTLHLHFRFPMIIFSDTLVCNFRSTWSRKRFENFQTKYFLQPCGGLLHSQNFAISDNNYSFPHLIVFVIILLCTRKQLQREVMMMLNWKLYVHAWPMSDPKCGSNLFPASWEERIESKLISAFCCFLYWKVCCHNMWDYVMTIISM